MPNKCTSITTTDEQINDIITLVNDIRSTLKGDFNVSKPGLAIGSTATAVSNVAFDFQIDGVRYSKAAVTAGTAPGNDVIPEDLFGAVAFDINAAGTISVVEAAANATGYATAALAIAGVADVADGKARMGYVTASGAEAAFTFGTTDLDAADTTVAYTDADTAFETIGSAVTLLPGQS